MSDDRGNDGPATDRHNEPVIDPTRNVLDLVRAETKRQDDLRNAEGGALRELMNLRADYDEKLRNKEADRIDAIRAVDVQAVQRAAEVAAAAVQALAAQVPITADAVRNALAAALDPIQRDVIALRQAQYEQQGQKAATTENTATARYNVGNVFAGAGLLAGIAALIGHSIH